MEKTVNKNVVLDLFKEMRHSTPEEQQLYRDMIYKYSIPLKEGDNIFDIELPKMYPNGTIDMTNRRWREEEE